VPRFFFYQLRLETNEEKKQDTYFHTSISAFFFPPVPGELSFTALTIKSIKKLVKNYETLGLHSLDMTSNVCNKFSRIT
jgi:hypothetical protein